MRSFWKMQKAYPSQIGEKDKLKDKIRETERKDEHLVKLIAVKQKARIGLEKKPMEKFAVSSEEGGPCS